MNATPSKSCNDQPFYFLKDNKALVLSVLSEGLGFAQVEKFLAKNRIRCPSSSQFYEIQMELEPIVQQMVEGTVLNYDAAWAHTRRSNQYIGTLIDQLKNKVGSNV